jgi:hypothetical protein
MSEFLVEHEHGLDLIEAPNLETAYELANQMGYDVVIITEA